MTGECMPSVDSTSRCCEVVQIISKIVRVVMRQVRLNVYLLRCRVGTSVFPGKQGGADRGV